MKSLLVAFTCLWGTTVLACACTCKGEKTVERAFQYHESIVHGKVLSITMVSKASTMNEKKRDSLLSTLDTSSNHYRSLHNKGTLRVEVAVITRFKGTSNSEVIIIHASPHGAACGYARFEIDQEFLIYGSSKSYQKISSIRSTRINYFNE